MTRPYLILGSSHVIQIFALYMAGAGVATELPLTLQASTASTCVSHGSPALTQQYLLLTQVSTVYRDAYGESLGISSLHYIALGLGLWLGAQSMGRAIDAIYFRLKRRNGGVGVPEMRIPLSIVSVFCTPAGLLLLYI